LKNKKIAVIGFQGFVGSAIFANLKKKYYNVIGVNRFNYNKKSNKEYDIVINSAMPSKRFWAKQNPKLDFVETVLKTKEIISHWKFKKLIQISSISSRCQIDTVYGKHKRKSEKLCLKLRSILILRLGPMYGKNLDKGVLIDLINNNNVYVDKNSKYSFTNIDYIANWITNNLHKRDIIELGANNFIILENLKKSIGSTSKFYGNIDNQIIKSKTNYNQDSYDVIEFLKNYKDEIQ